MKELLSEKGLKVTKPRLAVLEVLLSAKYPIRVEEVYEALSSKGFDLSTIYRTLNSFVDVHIAKKEINANKENVYSLLSDDDSHVLVCVKCHKKTPIEDCPYHEANEHIEETTGFHVLDHATEIYGICPECYKNK